MTPGPHIRKRRNPQIASLEATTLARLNDAVKLIGHGRLAAKLNISGDTLQHAKNGHAVSHGTATKIRDGLKGFAT